VLALSLELLLRVLLVKSRNSFVQAVEQIVNAVWGKLPPAVFVLPVGREGAEALQLRITAADLEKDNLLDVIEGFCTCHDIPAENVPRLAKSVVTGMYAATVAI